MHNKATIRLAETHRELALARTIRQQVFVEEQGIPAEMEEDGLNESAIHVLLSTGKEAIGTARMCIKEENEGEIARVAVIGKYRGQGFGSLLVDGLERIARDRKLARVFLHPHHYLEKFYASIGYTLVPGETSSAGEHLLITMEKRLQ